MSPLSFHPQATGFDPTNALALAEMANLAYKKKSGIQKQLKEWGFSTGKKNFEFFQGDSENTQAFLVADDEKIIVSFRGTQEIKDWATNLDFWAEPGPVGNVHGGFAEALAEVWGGIHAKLKELHQSTGTVLLRDKIEELRKKKARGDERGENIGRNDAPRTLWFAGHSLGGALATLAVAEIKLRKDDQPVHGLYTFGQPRTGDIRFAAAFDAAFGAQTFRFVNNNDLVTRIPTRSMNFSHVGQFRYFDVDGNLHDDISEWDRFLDRVKGRLEDFVEIFTLDLPFDGIEDHSMANGYIPNLKKVA